MSEEKNTTQADTIRNEMISALGAMLAYIGTEFGLMSIVVSINKKDELQES